VPFKWPFNERVHLQCAACRIAKNERKNERKNARKKRKKERRPNTTHCKRALISCPKDRKKEKKKERKEEKLPKHDALRIRRVVQVFSAKEPYISAEELYISTKEPYNSAQEPYM